jgi:hypothetical protein
VGAAGRDCGEGLRCGGGRLLGYWGVAGVVSVYVGIVLFRAGAGEAGEQGGHGCRWLCLAVEAGKV